VLNRLGLLSVVELEQTRVRLDTEIREMRERIAQESREAAAQAAAVQRQLADLKQTIVETEDIALLQESGVYQYQHPLSDAVSYQRELEAIEAKTKEMNRKDGGAILASTNWTVNGSAAQGRTMIRDFSKLMLRAFNAEADNLVRTMKPYKLSAGVERLEKVAQTIEKLGKTMDIRIAPEYLRLRLKELRLTADFLEKQAEEKEQERLERERLREEKKVQHELERERAKLEKERAHFQNALNALAAKGDEEGVARLRDQLADVDRAIADVDYREANIRAGYVYVISNIGSFGESVVKVGMTRRLDPLDRIRELSDASVPFNFDVHALFFSKDAVGIETAMHTRLAQHRVNAVNQRREFFRVTALQAKAHLAELAGELLEFHDVPEALEYRQSIASGMNGTAA
jgi:uncharacterized protein YlxW (UPF0749 family)